MAKAKVLRAVLVGCGATSGAWLKAAAGIANLQIVGLVDVREEAARKRASEYSLEQALISADLDEVLEEARPDLVFDCTVPEAHCPVTITALEYGCHVLGEKPMSDSLENARKMIAAAHKAKRLYAVVQNRRYKVNIRRLKKFLDSGKIGDITTVNCDFYVGAHFGGFREKMKHVLLLDMAIHTFDAARFLTGADPRAVFCKEWNPPDSWFAHDASAIATFDMSRDIVYCYRGSWCSEGVNTSWEGVWRIIGTQGTVTWDGGGGFQAQQVFKSGGFHSDLHDLELPPYTATQKVGGHAAMIREFVNCVRTGAIPETICTDNVKSLAMVFAAIESAERGAVVEIRT